MDIDIDWIAILVTHSIGHVAVCIGCLAKDGRFEEFSIVEGHGVFIGEAVACPVKIADAVGTDRAVNRNGPALIIDADGLVDVPAS